MSQQENCQLSSEFFNSRLNALKQMKKANHLQSQDTLSKMISKQDKEKIIIDLRLELSYLKELQQCHQANLDYIHSIVLTAEKNHSEINQYCSSLRAELKEFIDKIDWYESKISSLKEECEQLKRTNEAIISLKQTEHIQLETEHKKILDKINEQLFKIKCMKEEYQTQDSRKKKEKKELMEKEAKDIQQYNNFFKLHRDMLNHFNVYEQDDDASNLVELKTQRRIYRENIQKEELRM